MLPLFIYATLLRGYTVPSAVSEARHKLSLLSNIMMVQAFRPRIQQVLIEELCRIDSNNTTRQWITEMLRFFESAENRAREALGEVLRRRKLSTKLHAESKRS